MGLSWRCGTNVHLIIHSIADTDTDSRIFNHKNSLLSGSNFPVPYPSKFQRDPYLMPQQPGQQIMDESMYREQPQMTRNDWPQMAQQQPPQIPQIKQQSNSVWPEKLAKQSPTDDKAGRKKAQNRDSEYSEEYADGEESPTDDSTTTEAPKKVSEMFSNSFLN